MQSWDAATILPTVISALQTYDEYDVYRELDRLAKQEDPWQVFLYEQLKKRQRFRSEAFFYDITSSYFEGSRKHQLQYVEQSINQINESLQNAKKLRKSEVVEREVVGLYRRKNKVEEAFHEIKKRLQLL